jgi:hypothetical protein
MGVVATPEDTSAKVFADRAGAPPRTSWRILLSKEDTEVEEDAWAGGGAPYATAWAFCTPDDVPAVPRGDTPANFFGALT